MLTRQVAALVLGLIVVSGGEALGFTPDSSSKAGSFYFGEKYVCALDLGNNQLGCGVNAGTWSGWSTVSPTSHPGHGVYKSGGGVYMTVDYSGSEAWVFAVVTVTLPNLDAYDVIEYYYVWPDGSVHYENVLGEMAGVGDLYGTGTWVLSPRLAVSSDLSLNATWVATVAGDASPNQKGHLYVWEIQQNSRSTTDVSSTLNNANPRLFFDTNGVTPIAGGRPFDGNQGSFMLAVPSTDGRRLNSVYYDANSAWQLATSNLLPNARTGEISLAVTAAGSTSNWNGGNDTGLEWFSTIGSDGHLFELRWLKSGNNWAWTSSWLDQGAVTSSPVDPSDSLATSSYSANNIDYRTVFLRATAGGFHDGWAADLANADGSVVNSFVNNLMTDVGYGSWASGDVYFGVESSIRYTCGMNICQSMFGVCSTNATYMCEMSHIAGAGTHTYSWSFF